MIFFGFGVTEGPSLFRGTALDGGLVTDNPTQLRPRCTPHFVSKKSSSISLVNATPQAR